MIAAEVVGLKDDVEATTKSMLGVRVLRRRVMEFCIEVGGERGVGRIRVEAASSCC